MPAAGLLRLPVYGLPNMMNRRYYVRVSVSHDGFCLHKSQGHQLCDNQRIQLVVIINQVLRAWPGDLLSNLFDSPSSSALKTDTSCSKLPYFDSLQSTNES